MEALESKMRRLSGVEARAGTGVDRAEFGELRNLDTRALGVDGEDRPVTAISPSPSLSNGRFVPTVVTEAIFMKFSTGVKHA